jgi:large subunit ribosomal protein L24
VAADRRGLLDHPVATMPTGSSRQPRRQRRALYTADTFERRRRMSVPLSRDLRGRFHRRAIPIRKGDTVRVMSGSYAGREERVAKVDRRGYAVTLDNITGKTAEAKLKPLPIQLSHLLVTRLNLADPWRRRVLKVPEGEAEEEAAETAAAPSPSPEVEAPPASTPTPATVEKTPAERPAPKRASKEPPAKPAAKPATEEPNA